MRLAAALLAAAGLASVEFATRAKVTVILDGVPRTIVTHARTVAGALRDAGLRPGPSDLSAPDLDSPVEDGDQIEVRRARPVRIEVDGAVRMLVTAALRPENILADAGVRLYPGDRVWADGLQLSSGVTLPKAATRIRVERGLAVTLNVGGTKRQLHSSAPTLGQALWESGIRVRVADSLFPAAGSTLGGATGVRYEPAQALSLQVDGRTVSSWAAGESVGEALANAGVALVGLDYAVPDIGSSLPSGGSIRVVRVTETMEMEQDRLPFETKWAPAPEIEIDHQQLVDAGEAGFVANRTRVRHEDGQETRRARESEWVAIEPRDRVMGYGTKIVIRTLDTPNGPIEYWRAAPMYATSYSPCRLGVPNYCSTTMANGEPLQHGNAAFIVRWYRAMRGQYVYVPGYGTAKISDTGGGIPGRNWIDLGYTDSEYVSWHNWVTVYFLTPVPPESLIMWVLE
jgi:uncharacterized protein YabE (DUF348 family)